MKASKFSEAQIAFVLKQAEDGTAIGEVCRKAGISEATFYNWRQKYAGLMPTEMKRQRQLLRRWDDEAKVVGAETPTVDEFIPLIRGVVRPEFRGAST